MTNDNKITIGRAEPVDFPEYGLVKIPARIDTGAKTSAIWASSAVVLDDDKLNVVLFGESSPCYTGEIIRFSSYDKVVISTSTGELEERYKVRMAVRVGGRRIRASFTLADRSTQVYPVLIGRNILSGKFVVDVKHGRTLAKQERQFSENLKSRLDLTP